MKTAVLRLGILSLLLAGAGCFPALRETPPLAADGAAFSPGRAGAAYRKALELFRTRNEDDAARAASLLRSAAGMLEDPVPALLALAEIRVWQVEHEPDPDARERTAEAAVHAGQWCVEQAPDNAACLYRLAIAVGVQARERPGTGLSAMKVMLDRLETVRRADPALDHGGPDRVLALLYLRAPGWPSGPGDPDLGLEHAAAAVKIDPGFPPNQLALAEALAATDQAAEAVTAYRAAARLAGSWKRGAARDRAEWRAAAERALVSESDSR